MDLVDPRRFRPEPTMTALEIAEKSGVDLEFARRLRRALGLPEPADDEVVYGVDDLEVMEGVKQVRELGYDPDDMIAVARAMGQSMARVADAELRWFQRDVIEPMRANGLADEEIAARIEGLIPFLLDTTARELDILHRRHLEMALQHIMTSEASGEGTERSSVAFVDLVDFSRVSDDLEPALLGDLVNDFEDIAQERCLRHGARVSKVIGDAVMLISREPRAALEATTGIVADVMATPGLPAARAGIDRGEVMPLSGDYFGRPVNVAARITAFAFPGTVVASEEALEDLDDVQVSVIGNERLKGVGKVRLFKVKHEWEVEEPDA